MARKTTTIGLTMVQKLKIEEIIELEKSIKTLSHMLTINAQILNDILENNHIIIGSMLNQFIVGHNEQVKAVVWAKDQINEMLMEILKGGGDVQETEMS